MSMLGEATLVQQNSHKVWELMHAEAVEKDAPVVHDPEHGSGRVIKGNLTAYIRKVWPGTRTNKGSKAAVSIIRQYLRSTGNVVIQKRARPGNDGNAYDIFVRDTFRSAAAIPLWLSQRREDERRQEAKLTPHEAGEDREPLPVDVHQEQPVRVAFDGQVAFYTNGRAECVRCGRTDLKPKGWPTHLAKHRRDDERERLVGLQSVLDGEMSVPAALAAIQKRFAAKDEEIEDLQTRLNAAETALLAPTSTDADAMVELIRLTVTEAHEGKITIFKALSNITDVLGGLQ